MQSEEYENTLVFIFMSLSELITTIQKQKPANIERYISDLVLNQKNYPDFLNNFITVTVKDSKNEIRILVSPDYVSIGTNAEYLRVSLVPRTAQEIVDGFDSILPPYHCVDLIWKQAKIQLEPVTYSPKQGEPARTSFAASVKHNDKIQNQLKNLGSNGFKLGDLVAGHKKDIVLTNRLMGTNKVAIYGWHKKNGEPIQGLNASDHGNFYSDYSHGTRMIKKLCLVNGTSESIIKVLQEPELAELLLGAKVKLEFLRY